MQEELNDKLPVIKVIKNAYTSLFDKKKQFLIMSYLVTIPLFAVQYFFPVKVAYEQFSSTNVWINIIVSLPLLLLLGIFLLRLFMLGAKNQFKLTPSDLINIFGRTFFYSIALALVIILVILCVGLLFGLMLVIINSVAGENATSGGIISGLITSAIMMFVLLTVFRTQPTFVSIALNQKTIPMKSAYYYTRDNNWNLIFIGIACYVPIVVLTLLILLLNIGSLTSPTPLTMLLSFLLAPLNMMPYALQLSAGSEIYKYLVPYNEEGHNLEIDLTV